MRTWEERARLAARAGDIGRASRYGGAPVLSQWSSGAAVCRWLRWCDPNGTHAMVKHDPADPLCPHRCTCDGYETEDDAWTALQEMVEAST